MATKKRYNTPATTQTEEVVEQSVIDTTEQNTDVTVDVTDETKLVEEFVNAKSTESGPLYHIRSEWKNIATQKESFADVNDAIKECNNYPGYKVFTDDGIPIHFSTAVIRMSTNNAVAYPGKKYELKGAKLFANSTIDTARGIADGIYYLYDAQLINDRYRIVDNKAKVGKGIQFIAGYVAIEETY